MPTPERPSKPRPDFPLFPHKNGSWAKKIGGSLRYFGAWKDDPLGELALKKYLHARDYIQAGVPVPTEETVLTVRDLVNRFLHAKSERMKSGELSPRSFRAYRESGVLLVEHLGGLRAIGTLTPQSFVKLRSQFANGRAPATIARHVRHTRMMLKWGYDQELVDRPIRVGSEFVEPSRVDHRRERNRLRRERGDRAFSRDELLAILEASEGQLRAMVLLAINGGLGQTDCASLPRSAINLEAGWLDFPRPKTQVDRKIPLWPETIEAVREVIETPRKPAKNPADDDLVFLTRFGLRWVRMRLGKPRAGKEPEWVPVDSVNMLFNRLLGDLGIKRRGIAFYSIRHTFQTIGEEAGDTLAVAQIMGHVDASMGDRYRERFPEHRLRAVTDYVRRWLWPEN